MMRNTSTDGMASPRWQYRALEMANTVARWSKDPSTGCGAALFRPDKTLASMGFNGLPRQLSDDPAILHDRQAKYVRTLHAEVNAILHCRDGDLHGYTMAVWPMLPCARCAAQIIQSGIARVVIPDRRALSAETAGRWRESHDHAEAMLREAGVEVVPLDWPEGGRA